MGISEMMDKTSQSLILIITASFLSEDVTGKICSSMGGGGERRE
jgi:hypothetical protein